MKIRHGYVSNSSSSSFLIAIPKAVQETVDKDSIKEMFGIVPGSFIDKMIGQELVKELLSNKKDLESVLDNYGAEDLEELLDNYSDNRYGKHKRMIFNALAEGTHHVFEITGNSEDGTALDGMIYNADLEDMVLSSGTIIASMH